MQRKNNFAIYPGTFDPITKGHLDIINRSLNIFDHLIVAVAIDSSKQTLFDYQTRLEMVKYDTNHLGSKVSVLNFTGLLYNFIKDTNASCIIRGIRSTLDYEYESQLAYINRVNSKLDTIFLPSLDQNRFISSTMIKEITKFGGDVSNFVTENVEKKLRALF